MLFSYQNTWMAIILFLFRHGLFSAFLCACVVSMLAELVINSLHSMWIIHSFYTFFAQIKVFVSIWVTILHVIVSNSNKTKFKTTEETFSHLKFNGSWLSHNLLVLTTQNTFNIEWNDTYKDDILHLEIPRNVSL